MPLRSVVRDRPLWLLAGVVLLGAVSYILSSFIGLVVVGLFVYYAARPVYRRLVDRIGHPTVAAGLSIIALVLPAFLLVGYALLIVSRELRRLTNIPAFGPQQLGVAPGTYSRLTDPSFLLSPDGRELITGELSGSILQSVVSLAQTATTLGIVAINLLAVVVFAFYLLRDDDRLAGWIHANFDTRETVFEEFLQAVDRDLSSIFFGNILNAIITGTIGVVVYSLLNLVAPPQVAIPAAGLVGLFAGVASLIPVVGMKLVYVPITVYLGVASSLSAPNTLWFAAVFFAVSFVVVDTIPDLVLRPYVSGRHLHVGAVMIAYTLGPLLFGWYGIFLGPILLVLIVNFARHVLPVLMAREPLVPYTVDPGVVTGDDVTESESDRPTIVADGAEGDPDADGEFQFGPDLSAADPGSSEE